MGAVTTMPRTGDWTADDLDRLPEDGLRYELVDGVQLQPDIVVIPRRESHGARPEDLPLLVVEVLSPTTRATDLTLKRRVYEEGGIPSYWLFDAEDASLTVLELQNGRYAETRHTAQVSLQRPFPVTLVPSELPR